MTSKCTSIVAHFKGLMDVPEQYRWHCPMRHVQGYPRSHWMPPSGDYLLRIAPAATKVTANKTTTKNGPALLAISMAVVVRRYNTAHIAQWRMSRASLEATGHHHLASIAADCIKGTWLHRFFYVLHCQYIKKGRGLSQRPLLSIRILHIKQKRRA